VTPWRWKLSKLNVLLIVRFTFVMVQPWKIGDCWIDQVIVTELTVVYFCHITVLPVTLFLRKTSFLLVVWVILCSSIEGFVVRNCRFFHTFENNSLATVKKLVDPNLWSSVYYGFSLLHKFSLALQPWMSATQFHM
jgi:hypothetical protein